MKGRDLLVTSTFVHKGKHRLNTGYVIHWAFVWNGTGRVLLVLGWRGGLCNPLLRALGAQTGMRQARMKAGGWGKRSWNQRAAACESWQGSRGMFNVPCFGGGLLPSLCPMSANCRDVERRRWASHGSWQRICRASNLQCSHFPAPKQH